MILSKSRVPKKFEPYLVLVSYGALLVIQAWVIELLWWKLNASPIEGLGWKLGFVYGLFTILISGVQILSALMEKPEHTALRLGCPSMELVQGPGALVCRTVLAEVLQFRRGIKPGLFLVPSEEINAFSFQMNDQAAIFITRGAVAALSRAELKVLLTRQLLQLRNPKLKYNLSLCLSIIGFSKPFFSGFNLLRYSSFGKFETRENRKTKGHPLYFIGIIPLLVGLPGWCLSRLFLLWIDSSYVLELDDEVSITLENRKEMISILEKINQKPIGDMPPNTWPMRVLGLHHESFLESLLPLQPPLSFRIERLKQNVSNA